jgi:acyl carrier protein
MSNQELMAAVRIEICRLANLPMVEVQEDSDLFELGFDSLLVLQLVARLKAVFGVNLNVGDMFIAPTACAISDLIRDKRANGSCD